MATATRDRGKRISELVEDEAARAEAEPDDGDEDDPADDPDPGEDENEEAEEAEDGTSLEASLKAFEAEHKRHEDELRAIMGEDFEAFHSCPGCNGLGFQPIEGVQYASDLTRCETCKGHGVQLTGSQNEMYATRACLTCQGNGYVVKVTQPSQATPTAQAPQPSFDPYTGQPLATAGAGGAVQADGTWAPGFVPPAQPNMTPPPFN